jgi:hypothetical protein
MPALSDNRANFEYYRPMKGKLARKVEEGTEGAKRRDYTTPAGVEGTTWEIIKDAWVGKIYGVRIKDTDYGQVCEVRFEDAVITIPTSGGYFQSFATALKNVDLSKEVILRPYDFEADGKRRVGISLKQGETKIGNAYVVKQEDGSYKNFHGYPMVDEKKKNKPGYWKIYFAEVAMFLCDEIEKMTFPNEVAKALGGTVVEDPTIDIPNELRAEDVPF